MKRNPKNVAIAWTAVSILMSIAVVAAVAWPAIYLWALGLTACLAIGCTAVVILGQLGPRWLLLSGDIAKGTLYVIGVILSGLAEASR